DVGSGCALTSRPCVRDAEDFGIGQGAAIDAHFVDVPSEWLAASADRPVRSDRHRHLGRGVINQRAHSALGSYKRAIDVKPLRRSAETRCQMRPLIQWDWKRCCQIVCWPGDEVRCHVIEEVSVPIAYAENPSVVLAS